MVQLQSDRKESLVFLEKEVLWDPLAKKEKEVWMVTMDSLDKQVRREKKVYQVQLDLGVVMVMLDHQVLQVKKVIEVWRDYQVCLVVQGRKENQVEKELLAFRGFQDHKGHLEVVTGDLGPQGRWDQEVILDLSVQRD